MTIMAPVITIDGPSSVGKGTLCQALAETLKWHLLDSGALYRVLALIALNRKTAINNEEELVSLTLFLDVQFRIIQDRLKVICNKEDVSQAIRNETISKIASQIAVLPRVRKTLLLFQRHFRAAPGLVADGRDMGTIVFPDAPVKIFLEASLEERAYRRMRQLRKQGFHVSFDHILSKIEERDYRDRSRIIAPLEPASDAFFLDSTHLNTDEVLFKALDYVGRVLTLV